MGLSKILQLDHFRPRHRELAKLVEVRGRQAAINCDNGPQFCAQTCAHRREERGIEIRFIQPGKPNQNAFIEWFNTSYRDAVPDAHLCSTLEQVQGVTGKRTETCGEYPPHDAPENSLPALYLRKLKLENYKLELSA